MVSVKLLDLTQMYQSYITLPDQNLGPKLTDERTDVDVGHYSVGFVRRHLVFTPELPFTVSKKTL